VVSDPSQPTGPTLAQLDDLVQALSDTGWILALYPPADGIGPPRLAREGVWEGGQPSRSVPE
jgi:hypothetical protein